MGLPGLRDEQLRHQRRLLALRQDRTWGSHQMGATAESLTYLAGGVLIGLSVAAMIAAAALAQHNRRKP